MPSYTIYTADEFAQDDFFRKWVQSPDEETDTFWQNFLVDNPHQQAAITKARVFLRAVEQTHVLPTTGQGQRMWSAIETRIAHEPDAGVAEEPHYRIGWRWVAAAASVALLLGIGWWWFQPENTLPVASTNQTVDTAAAGWLDKQNDTGKPLTVQLADGSSVILQPAARLHYPTAFNGEQREVYLTGEGFFQIARNPQKPFLVYANELVTKVLGTSFTVRALEKANEVIVEVKTGRVSVFARSKTAPTEQTTQQSVVGMVLLPNQKAVFDRDDVRLTKSLVEQPALVVAPTRPNAFDFEDTPAPQVFASLERAYGIDIVFDQELLAECPLTATLTNQPLYDKLNVICKALEARYEVIDGQIVIYSKGCQ